MAGTTSKSKILLQYGGIFLLFFSIFLFGQLTKVDLFGYDAYYHAKHSALIAQSGNLSLVEPWVEYHFLSYAPVDPYWLFHVITAGFIKLFGTMLGIKIISALAATSVFLSFYIVLKKLNLKKPFIFTLLFFISSSSFLFRLLLERPFVISIACTLLGIYFIIKKRYLFLGILSTVYILLYNLAPILLFSVIIDLIIQKIHRPKLDLKPLIAALIGLTLGLLLHPHTTNYIVLIYSHFIQIFWLKINGVSLPSGLEIQIGSSLSFLKYNIFAVISFVISAAIYISLRLDDAKKYLLDLFFVISTIWFLLAMVIPRAIEYWIPFSWIFTAVLFTYLTKKGFISNIKDGFEKKLKLKLLKIFLIILIMEIFFLPFYNLSKYIMQENKTTDLSSHEEINNFLIKNTDKYSLVFYPKWSMFPKFFYSNTHNRYISAFDPVFTYTYNPEFFWIYSHIVANGLYCNTEEICEGPLTPQKNLEAIHLAFEKIFETHIIIMEKDSYTPLLPILLHDEDNYKKKFENEIFLIFEVL